MAATWAQQKELRLGRYVLKRPLGEGGNGQVFLAWQENEAGEPLVCVVKFPLQRYATQADGRERFLAEARLAMRLGMHPNIVHVIDVGRHRDMPFIVMEYVDGTDLHHLLKVLRGAKQGLSLASAYNILASTVEALHHAHAGATIAGKPVGVVHRDIKPGNILVTRDGVTKVGDFGIGATIDEGTAGEYMRGTHRYMSPEHLRCEVRPEMDMYAFGVVAWEVLENRQFREGVKGPQHFTAIMDGRIPAMENPDTPKQLVSIIEACLESNPRQRPVASEVLRALERCPGYTRDPSSVKADVTRILGRRRSSGQTQAEFTATPELVATLAALEAVQARSGQPGGVWGTPPLAGVIEEGGRRAPTTIGGLPPLREGAVTDVAPDREHVPAKGVGPRPAAIVAGPSSDAETPIAKAAPRAPNIDLAAASSEEDAPRPVRRPRSPARGEPTPTLPLAGNATVHGAREHTVAFDSLAPAASSGTEFVAPPWQSDSTAEMDATDAAASPGSIESGPASLGPLTEPGPFSSGSIESTPPSPRRASTEPGRPPVSHATVEALSTDPGPSAVWPGSMEPEALPSSPASTELAHPHAEPGAAQQDGWTDDLPSLLGPLPQSVSGATRTVAAVPSAASPRPPSVWADVIDLLRRRWPLWIVLAVAGGLVTAYLLVRFGDPIRAGRAREPSRTTQVWPAQRADEPPRKARHGGQAWQDEHGVTASFYTAPRSRRSGAIASDRGGHA